MEESIYELREAVGLEEINRLLATGRWKVRSLDWDDEIPVAKLVRNKRLGRESDETTHRSCP